VEKNSNFEILRKDENDRNRCGKSERDEE